MSIVESVMRDARVVHQPGDLECPYLATVYLDTNGALGVPSQTVEARGVDRQDALRELQATVAFILAPPPEAA